MIQVEFRNTPWSDKGTVREFLPGATVQEIVESFATPVEFESFGGVYLLPPDAPLSEVLPGLVLPTGHVLDRDNWARIKPKTGTKLFISLVPQGGGQGGGGKNIFALVGAIALVALTTFLTAGGGLAMLAPSIYGAGVAGASVATAVTAAAVGVAGAYGLSLLTRPAAGQTQPVLSPTSTSSPTLGAAGVSQNPLAAYQQVPGIRGIIRVSPPLLALPFTTIEDTDETLNMIVGVCGPCQISGIKINDTDIADLATGTLEYETREGWDSDAPLTLVTQSAFQQNINLAMSKHRLDIDNQSLIAPYSSAYPKPYIARTARRTKNFRWMLNFSGLADYSSGVSISIAFRLRMRRVGDSTWVQLPELHVSGSRTAPFRQEIWLRWGNDADEAQYRTDFAGATTLWDQCYYQNPEWTANSYFLANGVTPGTTDSNVVHVYRGSDRVYVHLDEDTFPIDQYDIEIVRGYIIAASHYTPTSYGLLGLFTYTTLVGSVETITSQSGFTGDVTIENYCSFRDEYPIAARNLALICIKAKNLQVSSLSAVFGSYVNTWDGADWNTVAVSNNPAALERDTQTGIWNKRPVPLSRLDDLSSWHQHAVDKGLACNYYATQASVEQVATLIAACGDAVLRRSDKWGVVVDKDTSGDPLEGAFHPGNMASALTVTKTFVTGARAIVPHIFDEDNDFTESDDEFATFDDGVPSSSDTLTESAPYDGITSFTLARRRAKLDLRRARLRTLKYNWDVHLSHLRCRKGSKIGLAHDILIDTYGYGRIKSFQKDGSGNLVAVTMNTNFADLPVHGFSDIYDVDDVYTLSDFFNLDGASVGLAIELPDSSIVTVPVSSVDSATLIVSGTVACPASLQKTCLAAIGRSSRETRRVILTNISPKDDFHATLEAVDAAPAIFAGY